MNYQARKEKFLNNQKRKSVLNLISSFAITVVAVVAIVGITQRIPKATIFEILPYGNEIYYHIEVIDDDHQIIGDSLSLLVSNQLEQYKIPLVLGEQSGSVASLRGGKEYQVDLVCDYGYGQGVLASSLVVTDTTYGGRITGWKEESFDIYQEMSELQIGLVFSDPASELSEVWLKYVYFSPGTYPEGNILPSTTEFTQYTLTSLHDQCIIQGLWEGQLKFFTYLEARTIDGEVVLLDSLIFTTPLKLFTSLYISDVGTNYTLISLYPDFETRQDITYQLSLISEGKIIQTKTYQYADFSGEEMTKDVLFTGLTPQTSYHLQLTATYLENGELMTIPLQLMDISLISAYQFNVSTQDLGTTLEVSCTLNDANQVVSDLYYYVYEVIEGNELYVTGGNLVLIEGESQVFEGIINISKDSSKQYRLYIYGTKTAFDGTLYQWTTIYQLDY